MFIKKNVIILHPADKRACAFYRCDAMASLLRSDRSGEIEVIVSRAEITDEYILKYTAAIGEDLQGVADVPFRLVPFVESIDKYDVEAFLVRGEEFVRGHLERGVSFLARVYAYLTFAIYRPESLASGGPDFKETLVFSRIDEGVY